jgi:hypothetical protein
MRPAFDPYHKWLGIPPDQQPPDYYRLLAIEPFESDPDVIQAAADQRMAHLRNYQTGPHSDLSQRLLNEVASARVCLLNAAKKAAYDGQLRAKLKEALEAAQEEYPLEPTAPPLANVLDELPYARRPRVSLHRTSAGFGHRVPAPAILGGLAILVGMAMGVMYWNGNLGWLATPSAEPRNGSAEGSAKIVKSGDNAGAKKAKRDSQAIDDKSPTEPPASVAKPAEATSVPSEHLPTKRSTKPDMASNEPPAAEEYVPNVSEHDAAPSLLEVPDRSMRNPPPDNPSSLSPSPAETKPAERVSAPPASSARLRVRFNKWFDLLSQRNELFDWEVRDGRYSYADWLIVLEDGCLFCPIVAKDAMIRATVRRSGSGAFVYLILRNSDEGCYAAALEDRTVRIFRLKAIAGAAPTQPVWHRRTLDMLGEFTLPKSNTYVATAVFQFGFSAVGNIMIAYINDIPLWTVKDSSFAEGTVGIGVRNSPRGYFTDVELKIPNKAAFVTDQRPLPIPAKSTAPSDPKPPAK